MATMMVMVTLMVTVSAKDCYTAIHHPTSYHNQDHRYYLTYNQSTHHCHRQNYCHIPSFPPLTNRLRPHILDPEKNWVKLQYNHHNQLSRHYHYQTHHYKQSSQEIRQGTHKHIAPGYLNIRHHK